MRNISYGDQEELAPPVLASHTVFEIFHQLAKMEPAMQKRKIKDELYR